MDDKESKSPWGQLAQDLGAEPSSESFERSQPPAVEIPAAEATSEQTDASDEMPQQSPSDWNALAGSLGLEVPEPPASQPETESAPPAAEVVPEPVEEVAASSVEEPSEPSREGESFGSDLAAENATDSLPPLPSEVDQIMSEGDWENEEAAVDDQAGEEDDQTGEEEEQDTPSMSGNAAKNAFDALFGAVGSALAIPSPKWGREEKPINVEESTDSEDAEEAASDSEDGNSEGDDKEERPKRRRSRRGRGRGRGRKTEAEQTTSEETPGEETAESEVALNGEDRKESDEEESSDDGKKRRRRPRRRSRRSASEDNPTKTDDSSQDDESIDTLTYGDNELAEDRETSQRDSIGHRNMPTWTEALSSIIEGNLELHSKAPSRQSSSRGRGRGRGGRGRGRGSKT